MTEEQIHELKATIEERIDQLETMIPGLEDASKPIAPDSSLGRLTRMDAIANRGVSQAGLSETKETIRKLKEKLQQIDTESFGLCQQCNQEIAFARLQYMPETDRCVHCS